MTKTHSTHHINRFELSTTGRNLYFESRLDQLYRAVLTFKASRGHDLCKQVDIRQIRGM